MSDTTMPLEELGKIIFFVLFCFIAIAALTIFYDALFGSDSVLPEMAGRIEFAVCGGHLTIEQRDCSSKQNASTILAYPAEEHHAILFFNAHDDVIDVTGVREFARASRKILENPCDGPCICERDMTRGTQVVRSECIDLDFDGEEITLYTADLLNARASIGNFFRLLVSEQSYLDAVRPQAGALFYEQRSEMYLIYITYDAERRNLYAIPFDPESLGERT